MDTEEKQVHQVDEAPQNSCSMSNIFGPHNQARLVSILLTALLAFILWAYLQQEIYLDTVQLTCLYISMLCVVPLMIGAFITIPMFYMPAVFVMRLVAVFFILYNMLTIFKYSKHLETFTPESSLRSKASTVAYLNRNFTLLKKCIDLGAQTWICLLILGALQNVAKDFYHLYATNASPSFCFGPGFGRFFTLDWLRFGRSKNSRFETDANGKTVESKFGSFDNEVNPDSVHVVQHQHQHEQEQESEQEHQQAIEVEAEEHHKAQKFCSSHPSPKMSRAQLPKPPTNPHPIKLIQEQIAKFKNLNDPSQPEDVSDQHIEPLTDEQEQAIIEHCEHYEEKYISKFETFVC